MRLLRQTFRWLFISFYPGERSRIRSLPAAHSVETWRSPSSVTVGGDLG